MKVHVFMLFTNMKQFFMTRIQMLKIYTNGLNIFLHLNIYLLIKQYYEKIKITAV